MCSIPYVIASIWPEITDKTQFFMCNWCNQGGSTKMLFVLQVLTRVMFSSSPLLYWFTAWLTTDLTTDTADKVNRYNVMKSVLSQQYVEDVSNLNSKVYNIVTDQLFQWNQCTSLTKLIYLYFLGYTIIGTAAFCNFFPWT